MNIQDIRKKYPQYNDLSDQDLAAALHQKFYADLAFEDFASRVGLGAAPAAPTTPAPTPAVPPLISPEEAPAAEPTAAPAPSKFSQFLEAAKPEAFTREVLDIPLKIAEGVVTTSRMAAEVFGANNEISKSMRGVEKYLASLASAQSKQDSEAIARTMQEAEDAGVGEQLKAALKAFSIAPVDMLSQAAGSTVPILLGAVAGAPGVLVTSAAVGTGLLKGAIYDTVKEELIKTGAPPNVAEDKAQEAQAYGGKNLDMILAGTALGTIAGRTGVERMILNKIIAKEAAERGVAGAAARGAVEEAVPEIIQASQEQLAKNIALQREGFDVPTMRGVVGAGALEGIAGGTLGAGVGVATRTRATPEERLIAGLDAGFTDLAETTPPAGAPTTPVTPEVTPEIFQNLYTAAKTQLGREPTADELERLVTAYEQRTVREPDATGRIEPSLQVPSEAGVEAGVTTQPEATGTGAVDVSGVPAAGVGT